MARMHRERNKKVSDNGRRDNVGNIISVCVHCYVCITSH